MVPTPADAEVYELLEGRLRTLLPEEYQDTYQDVQPVSMGSAGLKFGDDGRVLWDEIWGSFCHLALAGGPPHRGTLLEPATKESIDADRARYREVVDELCRGIGMVSGLAAMQARAPGWLHVDCPSKNMAGWLARAITMENVSARVDGMVLHLPAGPHFRIDKEIKNVITSVAKTCHYWLGHTSVAQHRAVGNLLKVTDAESPLIQPPFTRGNARLAAAEALRDKVAVNVEKVTSLKATGREYQGWLGVDALRVPAAVWMVRVMVASNVLCRREKNFVYVPVDASVDRTGDRVVAFLHRAHRFACAQGVF